MHRNLEHQKLQREPVKEAKLRDLTNIQKLRDSDKVSKLKKCSILLKRLSETEIRKEKSIVAEV